MRRLSITAPGDESGTYDSFIELALLDLIEAQFPDDEATADIDETEEATHLRTPGDIYVASANDNAIIQGVAGFPTSLGFVGLAYAEHATDQVKILQVDGGDGCVAASPETVADGSYPISRPLFIYPNLGRAAENAAIVGYVDYYLSDEGIANVTEAGYVQMPAEELEASRARRGRPPSPNERNPSSSSQARRPVTRRPACLTRLARPISSETPAQQQG